MSTAPPPTQEANKHHATPEPEVESTSASSPGPSVELALAHPDLPEDRRGIADYVQKHIPSIATATSKALKTLLAEDESVEPLPFDIDSYLQTLSVSGSDARYCDFLEFAVGGGEPELTNSQIARIDELIETLRKRVPFKAQPCPFSNSTESQLDFYGRYPEVADVCESLKAPIIETNEADFFGIISINPYTAKFAADVITQIIYRDTKVVPFSFLTTCGKRPWDYLCAKHFGYES